MLSTTWYNLMSEMLQFKKTMTSVKNVVLFKFESPPQNTEDFVILFSDTNFQDYHIIQKRHLYFLTKNNFQYYHLHFSESCKYEVSMVSEI